VTVHLCVDRARERSHASKDWQYAVQEQVDSDFEAQLVDSLAAAEVAPLLQGLPRDQTAALWLRADGLSVAAIAARLSVSEKAAESLLGRARAAARAIVAAVAGAATVAGACLRRSAAVALPAAAVACAVTVLTLSTTTRSPSTRAEPAPVLADRAPSVLSPASLLATLATRAHTAAMNRTTPPGRQLASPLARSPRDVHTALISAHDGGAGYQDQQQSFVESVEQCVKKGIVISPGYVGCKTVVSPS
jgi:hypothetical protein